jgi:peptidoglycan/LPS O-acetylase OafA/YrhL
MQGFDAVTVAATEAPAEDSPVRLAYVPALDGLRGIAILLVMVWHTGVPFLKGGYIGVDIFFVLSGFLITALLLQEYDHSGRISIRRFYLRRALRLLPAYLVMLAVFCAVSFAVLNANEAKSNMFDALIALGYLSNWVMAFSIRSMDFLGHTWSLAIEEQFYLMWPLLLIALLRLSTKRYQIVVAVILLAMLALGLRVSFYLDGAAFGRINNGLDTRSDGLMIGCSGGIIWASGFLHAASGAMVRKFLLFISPLAMAALAVCAMRVRLGDPRMILWGVILVELLVLVIILDVLMNPRSIVGKVLAMKWLVWIGMISYGLYLWHYPIYRTLANIGFPGLAGYVFCFLVPFAFAALSYYVIEKPVLRTKQRYAQFSRGAPTRTGSGVDRVNAAIRGE